MEVNAIPLATDILSIYTPKFFATQGLKASVYDSNIATTEWANQFHELTSLKVQEQQSSRGCHQVM